MKRRQLLQLLDNYHPAGRSEIIAKQKIINFVNEYPNCFERSLELGHITASCWLLNKDGSRALLTHHAKLDAWFQLGGHCDGDSDVCAVAVKEAQEESGISEIIPVSTDIFDIDVHLIPENKKEKAHYHYDVRFLLQVQSDEDIVISNESKALRWIDKDPALLPTQEESVTRMFYKWLES